MAPTSGRDGARHCCTMLWTAGASTWMSSWSRRCWNSRSFPRRNRLVLLIAGPKPDHVQVSRHRQVICRHREADSRLTQRVRLSCVPFRSRSLVYNLAEPSLTKVRSVNLYIFSRLTELVLWSGENVGAAAVYEDRIHSVRTAEIRALQQLPALAIIKISRTLLLLHHVTSQERHWIEWIGALVDTVLRKCFEYHTWWDSGSIVPKNSTKTSASADVWWLLVRAKCLSHGVSFWGFYSFQFKKERSAEFGKEYGGCSVLARLRHDIIVVRVKKQSWFLEVFSF